MDPAPHTTAPPAGAAVIVAGDDGVPLRVREELAAAGVPTVSVCSHAETRAAQACAAAGAPLVIGDLAAPATWEQAGAARARAVGLLGAEDLRNLDAALLVSELLPQRPLVVRLFSADLASGVARMLGEHAVVLSETEVAAPAFVQAALSGNTGQKVVVGGHALEVAEVDPAHPALVAALCNVGDPTDVLPPRARHADRVLALVDPLSVVEGSRGAMPATVARHRAAQDIQRRERRRRRAPLRARLRSRLRVVPPRAWALLAVVLGVYATSTAVFALADHLSLVDALYFTGTTMATVGYGDVNLLSAPDWLKLYDLGLMGVSALLIASVLALVTDTLVSSRIDRALGRFPRPTSGHVVVCGLGKAGASVLARLHELEVPCIGVDQDTTAVGVAVARRLEIPVAFADARAPGTLASLGVAQARAVLAVTSDDLANLQCALAAREHSPELRVVLRIFDAQLAERLDRNTELDLTRSVSALAAPAFTAALLGRSGGVALALSNVPLRVVDARVGRGSAYAGRTLSELHHGQELRVLALDGTWHPREDRRLDVGADVSVVGTREACEELVRPDV